jgi:putative membrane protein insertion efficiency factor
MRKVFIVIIKIYQLTLSRILPPSCRFVPSCSEYMIDAVRRHGFKGLLMGCWRILRCSPFTAGGYDPVP